MSYEEAVLLIATPILTLALCRRLQQRKRRVGRSSSCQRPHQGAYHNLTQEMRLGNVNVQ